MEITKIFIAAQPDNLKTDISELEIFIHRINNCYVSRGHYFTPILSENISDDATRESEIADCALAFFLTEPGAEPPDTYKTALNSYNKTGKPRIFVYTKIQELRSSAQKARGGQESGNEQLTVDNGQLTVDNGQLINSTLHTPHSTLDKPNSTLQTSNFKLHTQFSIFNSQLISRPYAHIDTLKLDILMQIKQLNLDGVDIHLEDGKAWQGNTELLSLENVEAVSGYENLQNLKQKRAELESRYIEAKARYAETPDDQEAYEAFTQASGERSTAIGEIRNIEDQLFSLMEGMYIQTAKGNLSKRQEEAYRLVERGLLSEARDVLDFYSIVSESRHDEEHAEQLSQRALIHVNEQMQLKDINAAMLDWEGVDECYKEAVRLEEKHDLPRNAAVLYVEHLYYQHRYMEAIELGEKIRGCYNNPGSTVPDEEKSLLYNFLGIIYMESNHIAESEEMHKAALEIRLRRTDGSLEWIEREIAGSYNGLGNLYYYQNRFAEAEEAHKKALEIRKKWAEVDPDVMEPSLGWTYVNLGAVYNEDDEKTNEVIELMSAARDIFKKLAVSKPEPNEGYLSQCYLYLGAAYTKLQRFEEAEEQYNNALQLQLRLAGDNPNAYEPLVAETYTDYANLLFRAKRYQEALDKYNVALLLYKKLSNQSPDAFEPLLAKCHVGLAELYIGTQRFADAETALNTSIKLYDKYAETNAAYAESADDARKALAGLNAKQLRAGGTATELTPQEQEIALLLTDGESKSEIARKLHMNAEDVDRAIKAIREKVAGIEETDPVIASIVKEYKLTRREADVFRYLHKEVGTDIIASELFLSEETVRVHVRNLLRKLSINDRQKVPGWLESYKSHMS